MNIISIRNMPHCPTPPNTPSRPFTPPNTPSRPSTPPNKPFRPSTPPNTPYRHHTPLNTSNNILLMTDQLVYY